jgi:hypothetical protein
MDGGEATPPWLRTKTVDPGLLHWKVAISVLGCAMVSRSSVTVTDMPATVTTSSTNGLSAPVMKMPTALLDVRVAPEEPAGVSSVYDAVTVMTPPMGANGPLTEGAAEGTAITDLESDRRTTPAPKRATSGKDLRYLRI